MRRSEIIDYIKASVTKLVFGSLASYENIPETDDLVNEDIPSWQNVNDLVGTRSPIPFIYNIPSGSETPIIINFEDSTIKIGSAAAVNIGTDLSKFQANPDILFEVIIDGTNTYPKTAGTWVDNKEWADNTYTSLVSATLQPDTDTGFPGGLTRDNINVIIKP